MKQQLAHHTVAANVFDDHAQLLNDLSMQANQSTPDSWYFRRFVIQSSCKPKVLKFLADHKRITASTIFPDVVGLGRFLRWQFESLRTMLTLERTSTGLALGPRCGSGHHPPRGPSANPAVSAQLKR
jgi:hypothetical protein